MLIFILNFLLFSNAVTLRRDKSILFARTAIISLLFTSFLAYDSLYIKSLSKGIGLYGGLFNVTTFTLSINIFIFLVSGAILTLSGFYPRKICYEKATMNIPEIDSNYERKVNQKSFFTIIGIDGTSNTENSEIKEKSEVREKIESIVSNKTAEQFRIIEYPLIIIFIICGATFLTSTSDLISVFLSIELQSYGLYILSTIYRDSESATASGLTYFLLGGLSSCFILLGSALLYANSGTTNLDNIYVINSISQIGESFNTSLYQSNYIQLSLIIMIVGFLFKVSAAPFHFWSPDVYDGIPTIVTTYVAIVPKISIFAFFLELVYYTESSIADFSWKNILLLSSLLSLIIGSVLGLTQFRIKRLFAYSTISHVGFILLALSVNNVESIQAYIFYIFQYSISNLNGFLILVTIGYTFYLYVDNKQSNKLTDKNNSPVQLITQIKGYFYINHFIAISLAVTLFSFVGVPPLIGFFAKQMILSAALDSGHVFMALVAIITSVIGAAYYLNLIKQIFFYREDYSLSTKALNYALTEQKTSKENIERNSNGTDAKNNISSYKESSAFNLKENIVISTSLSSSISILTLLLILFIYMPEEWFNVVSIITLVLFKS